MKWVVISVRMFAVLSGIFLLMYDTVDVVDRFLPATYATYATAYAKGMHVLLVLLGAGLILGGILGRRILPAADLIGVGSCHPEPWKMGWNHAWQIAALLTLLSLGLRGYGLNRSMQIDEVFLFKSMVTQSPVKIFLHPSGSAHLLQTLLANLLVRLLGEHVWVARLPALLFGSLTPALLYLMVRRWFGTCAALCASVFLVFSPLHIWYSQEAKGNVLGGKQQSLAQG